MTLLTYEIFETIVQEKSFQKAASLLNMTPSAVSHAISGMEKEVGFSLFIRGKQETTLTTHGELLLPYIRAVLKSEESLQETIAEFRGLEKGMVKLGGFNSVCSLWIPHIVKEFQEKFPNIRIEIYQGTYADLVEWLRNGTIDLCMMSGADAEGFDYMPLYRDRLLCVVPKGFKTKHETYITFDEMRNERFVTQWASCDSDVQKVLKKHDLEPSTYCHVVDDMSTIAMVEAEMGICILPELLKEKSHMVEWYPMEEDCYREIGIAVNNYRFVSPAVKKMIEVIKAYIEKI
jgi:DNA-binding transcriptional LysR family regulator